MTEKTTESANKTFARLKARLSKNNLRLKEMSLAAATYYRKLKNPQALLTFGLIALLALGVLGASIDPNNNKGSGDWGIWSSITSAFGFENENHSTLSSTDGNLQLSKEYIYAGSRMLAIEDYGLSSATPTPSPTATPPNSPTPTPSASPTPSGRTNVALASNGAIVTASSTLSSAYPASSLIDGIRHSNNQYGNGGTWVSNLDPASQAQLVEVQFAASTTVDEIDVFTLADAIQYTTNPSLTDTFAQYGLIAYTVEYWNGSNWSNLGTATSNDKVWRQFTFSPVSTDKIRINITQAGPNAGVAHLVEIEAWSGSNNATPTPTPTATPSQQRANVALASNGAGVSATSTLSTAYPESSLIDGVRHTNNQYSNGGSWVSNVDPANQSQTVEVQFSGAKTIDEINVFTIADAIQYTTNPSLTDTFTQYGVIAFTVEYWNGSAWTNVGNITNNNKVWNQLTFSPVTTTKIRIVTTQAGPNAGVAHLVEVEAWGGN